ncbi:calcium and integrin-binding family member 2 [Octopus bimaculoides]|uniref:EF-hand domain-containing protein n=1 Tax=Octopus bimaculoides TaxID=37653 RepID=A0A0L8H6I1_OCTBM|nr:calcium and integrin-binding family member 2 [Octopus bimaculoides]|eukprot:XP_014775000.1 PREDICTED: calcium and integrin-binding family member 2-like [Octopus bimaculoides]
MGNQIVTFSEEQLNAYQDCTFFNRKDILRVFGRFKELSPDTVPMKMTTKDATSLKIPLELLEKLPEFKENPFRQRIFQVFSADNSGNLTFDEFLDLFSIFSDSAPRELKASYAFKIYDFDNDKSLGKTDLDKTLECLTRNELTEKEREIIVNKVLEEGDFDHKGKLSYVEFEYIISRDPEFLNTFHIRI